jgi:very-short-patch-repair endonuclease
MSVQQRLTTGERLRAASASHAGRTRRAFIATVIGDVCDGAHSLGELDFAAMCRRRGLPEPDRQVVRHGPDGRVYLDVGWHARRLVVEIDGSGHRRGLSVTADNLRANAVTLGADRVLRIDLLGLRVCPEAFLDQVTLGLAS